MTAAIVGNERTGARASAARHVGWRVDSRLAAVGDAGAGHVNRFPDGAVTLLAEPLERWRPR